MYRWLVSPRIPLPKWPRRTSQVTTLTAVVLLVRLSGASVCPGGGRGRSRQVCGGGDGACPDSIRAHSQDYQRIVFDVSLGCFVSGRSAYKPCSYDMILRTVVVDSGWNLKNASVPDVTLISLGGGKKRKTSSERKVPFACQVGC